jgi:glycosyltransferase involved in cell wall biosynthesis
MRVVLIHQHDPGIAHVGGIGTFINTFIKFAPKDVDVGVVGVSADPTARPVGRWQRILVEGRPCDFLPIVAAHPNHRGMVPLSLRFTWALRRYRRHLGVVEDAIIELHRIEPALALRHLGARTVLFLHAHPQDLHNPQTEVIWGRFPWAYCWLERRLINAMARIFVVQEEAASFYRARYPTLADRVAFLPTWVDEEVFASMPEAQRQQQRRQLARAQGVDPADRLLLFVGRFEGQKDPLLLLETFRQLNGLMGRTRLVMIGEGSLEPDIQAFLAVHGLTRLVRLIGPQPQSEIARWMNSADCLALSSAYEGMPRVVLEALQCGLPVVTTDAGEARRVVQGTAVGRLVRERTPQALGAAIAEVLRQRPDRAACQHRVAPYTARKILAQVYAAYRELHDHAAR